MSVSNHRISSGLYKLEGNAAITAEIIRQLLVRMLSPQDGLMKLQAPADGKVRQGIGFAMLLSRRHHWLVDTHREPMNARTATLPI
jgi:hypothetical protein